MKSSYKRYKKRLLAGMALLAVIWLLAACGYNTPQGGGGLTPYVIVVTPTATTVNATTTAATTVNVTTTLASTTVAATTTPPADTSIVGLDGNTYTVQKGDTLHGIANKLHVDYQQLLKVNNISDPDKLQIGQQLTVPPQSTTNS